MMKRLRGVYFFVFSIIIALLHFPFAFAKTATAARQYRIIAGNNINTTNGEPVTANSSKKSVYDSLHLEVTGLSRQAYDFAKKGHEKLKMEGRINNTSVLSIIDFTLPSNKKRLFIIDLDNYQVLFNTYTAHGRNTGREWATSFSNQHSSYKSSPGFFITRETYRGKHGLSLKLEGLEKGVNNNAFERGIVIHGAAYVSESVAKAQGFVGRSEGCPAVPENLSSPIINTIKNGTCLFVYHPSYINRSAILN